MAFEQTIQQWISLDDQIKTYSSKIKELREKKNILENKATLLACENKLVERILSRITSPCGRRHKCTIRLSWLSIRFSISSLRLSSKSV